MDETKEALESLKIAIENREKRTVLGFDEFADLARKEPERILRNIFQLFHDMVRRYVGEGEDEYPGDPESIGFVEYDCSKIFAEGSDTPFFADMLFANRFVRQVSGLSQGAQQNKIHVFKGPHGCGKSTFLNNLLRKFEEYTETRGGQSFEIFWNISVNDTKIEVPCPSHDHPILIIPKLYRADFLNKLLPDSMQDFKRRLLANKEYAWIFENEVCTICKSIFWALFDKLGSLEKVLDMVRARPYIFDRRLGEGISVFNPGDRLPEKAFAMSDRQIQMKLDKIFGASVVKYVYSKHAKTNNGIYVLMDIKSHNVDRLLELHNVISEGVHKVDDIEERVNSLFLALMNPEDKAAVEKETKAESFQGRIQYNEIRYVLDVPTEVNIYCSVFGNEIKSRFLPKVLENFARVIISSRMKLDCAPLKEWIPNFREYSKYCDEPGRLLRMSIYGGIIPSWLSDEDRKKFTMQVRRKLIAEGENEGEEGITGRESIRLFGDFFIRHEGKPNLINMGYVTEYFKHGMGRDRRDKYIPQDFIVSLVKWYDHMVLGEIKEALYFYNKDQITEDILNYLCAVSYDMGSKIICPSTGKEIEVTLDYFKALGVCFTGKEMSNNAARSYAEEIQKRYTELIAKDWHVNITETELYKELSGAYTRNLKEKVLHQQIFKTESFRDAVKAFGTEVFETFDTRLKEHIVHMIKALVEKFSYTEQGAKEICLYMIDQKLAEKFS